MIVLNGRCELRAASVVLACVLSISCLTSPASARLDTNTLAQVNAVPPPGARLPAAIVMTDENGANRTLRQALGGRPNVLILADFTCRTLCGPVLAIAAAGLAKTGLRAGKDFGLVVVGLDPKDSADDARAMQRDQIGEGALTAASTFLRGDEAAVHRIAEAIGYRYAYDATIDQYAHPATVFITTADGRISRNLSGLALDAADLRLALVEAGNGQIGTFADHLRLLCYGFDPAKGIYTLTIQRWLAFAAGLTILALAGAIGFMLLRRPGAPAYRAQSAPSERA
jgi:protein SCO1/2